jgi:cell division protein FtsL
MKYHDDKNCKVRKKFEKILSRLKEKLSRVEEAKFWTFLYTATFAAVVIIMVSAKFVVWYLLQFRK